MMEVKHNKAAMMPEYKKYDSNLSKTIDKLSSGYKINPTDGNTAGLAVSEKMNAQINALKQEAANTEEAISMCMTFEGALSEIHSVLEYIKSIAVKAATDIDEDQIDRNAIELEYEHFILEIDKLAQTDFNGIKALAGEETVEGESLNTFNDINATSFGLGLAISEVNLLTDENAAAAVEKINIATHKVVDIRTKIGEIANCLEHKANNFSQTIENLSGTESRLRDDMAKEINPFKENPLQSQISQALLAGANKLPKSPLDLLQ
jgi:flagellin